MELKKTAMKQRNSSCSSICYKCKNYHGFCQERIIETMNTGRNCKAIIHEPWIREKPYLGSSKCFRTTDKGTHSTSHPAPKRCTAQVYNVLYLWNFFSMDLLQCKTSAKKTHVARANVWLLRVLPTTAVPANTLTWVQTAPQVSAGSASMLGFPCPGCTWGLFTLWVAVRYI